MPTHVGSPLFPYTTLFRSAVVVLDQGNVGQAQSQKVCHVLTEPVVLQLAARGNVDVAQQRDPLPVRGQVVQKRVQLVHTYTSNQLPQRESKPLSQINDTQSPSSPLIFVVT